MTPRHWAVVVGLLAAAVASCWVAIPGRVATKYSGPPLAQLDLPDLDGDGKREILYVRPDPDGKGNAMVTLYATRGDFTHEVMPMQARTSLALTGARPRWTLADAENKAHLDVRLIENGKFPDLVMLADGQGMRYRYVEKGFLKLGSTKVVPGYSVGMVQLGDNAETMGVLGDAAITEGTWHPAAPPNTKFELKKGQHDLVASIVYDNQALVATNGAGPGMDEASLAKLLPGRRDGDHWVSPRYGMRALLDARGRATVMELSLPWKDAPGANPAKP